MTYTRPIRSWLAVFALALLACPSAAGAQDAAPALKIDPSQMIATAYSLLTTTFYRPVDGAAIRAGADAAILAYASKHGAKNPSIPAQDPAPSGEAAWILAD